MIKDLLDDLRNDEGFSGPAYQDHLGFWTIGYGRLIDERRGGGISRAEADMLLQNDALWVCDEMERRWPGWKDLPEGVRRATANMAFQLGVNGCLNFRNMWRAIRHGDWATAADHALDSKWAKQTPERAARVAALIRKGA